MLWAVPQPCQNAPNETVSYGHSRTPGNHVRPGHVLVAGDRSGDLIRMRSMSAGYGSAATCSCSVTGRTCNESAAPRVETGKRRRLAVAIRPIRYPAAIDVAPCRADQETTPLGPWSLCGSSPCFWRCGRRRSSRRRKGDLYPARRACRSASALAVIFLAHSCGSRPKPLSGLPWKDIVYPPRFRCPNRTASRQPDPGFSGRDPRAALVSTSTVIHQRARRTECLTG